MNEQEREELIENLMTALIRARLNGFNTENTARAALAVAEPVIRGECARIAEQRVTTVGNGKDQYSLACRHIAAAIREGKHD